jgi:hypothetical protein
VVRRECHGDIAIGHDAHRPDRTVPLLDHDQRADLLTAHFRGGIGQ